MVYEYIYALQNDYPNQANVSIITSHSSGLFLGFLVRKIKIYSLSQFWVHHVVLLRMASMLCSRCPEFTYPAPLGPDG